MLIKNLCYNLKTNNILNEQLKLHNINLNRFKLSLISFA